MTSTTVAELAAELNKPTTLLLEQDITERQFGSWSMGYRHW